MKAHPKALVMSDWEVAVEYEALGKPTAIYRVGAAAPSGYTMMGWVSLRLADSYAATKIHTFELAVQRGGGLQPTGSLSDPAAVHAVRRASASCGEDEHEPGKSRSRSQRCPLCAVALRVGCMFTRPEGLGTRSTPLRTTCARRTNSASVSYIGRGANIYREDP